MNMKYISNVPISDLSAGDTVSIDGVLRTVCKKDIRYCQFMGYSLFGASYPRLITKVVFPQLTKAN